MKLSVSICVPAFNEEKNIEKILHGLLAQKTKQIIINKIIVVSSGSTDKTAKLTKKFTKLPSIISCIEEETRKGKAAAINIFLRQVNDPVVVIQSADTIPEPNTIEKLCRPFIDDAKVGMTGGAPIPVNDPETFLGYIIHSWWWFHRNIPRFGEIIAYRNILEKLPITTAVDEAYIQAKMVQEGFKVIHVDEAIVHNKGPETVHDLIKQRRRIFNGHSRLYSAEKVKIDNMTQSSLHLLLFKYQIKSFKHLSWFIGGIAIEIWARVLGHYDTFIKKENPFIWDTAKSTKDVVFMAEEVIE